MVASLVVPWIDWIECASGAAKSAPSAQHQHCRGALGNRGGIFFQHQRRRGAIVGNRGGIFFFLARH
jgi:hypothetical protein